MGTIRKENLKAYLRSKKITQKGLADALKIKPPTVAEWLSGKRSVPDIHAQKICEILGVSMSDLCLAVNPMQEPWTQQAAGQMLLQLASDLSDSEREQLIALALQLKLSRLKLPSQS